MLSLASPTCVVLCQAKWRVGERGGVEGLPKGAESMGGGSVSWFPSAWLPGVRLWSRHIITASHLIARATLQDGCAQRGSLSHAGHSAPQQTTGVDLQVSCSARNLLQMGANLSPGPGGGGEISRGVFLTRQEGWLCGW